jgi:hypothetical protein
MADMVGAEDSLGSAEVSEAGNAGVRPQGVMYEIQRLLLGRSAASLLFALRDEEIRNRDPRRRSIRLPQEASWVVTSNYWPIDGSWQPLPMAVTLLAGSRFRASVERLRSSLDEQPLTGSTAFQSYEKQMASKFPRPSG